MEKNQKNGQQGNASMPGRGKQEETVRKADSAKKSTTSGGKDNDWKTQQGSKSDNKR